MSQDEELAEAMLANPPKETPPRRRMSEFSPVVELLSVCADRLAEVAQVIAATKGAKPGRVKPMPRPVTAMDRIRERRRLAKHKSLVARVLPARP